MSQKFDPGDLVEGPKLFEFSDEVVVLKVLSGPDEEGDFLCDAYYMGVRVGTGRIDQSGEYPLEVVDEDGS